VPESSKATTSSLDKTVKMSQAALIKQFGPPSDETASEALAPLVSINICMIILNTVFLILRFFTVLYLRPKKLGLSWDDWLLVPAYICSIGNCIVVLGK
jgi:hypothetical protein